MTKARCKVLLVDDNPTFLRQVRRFLDTVEDIDVVGATDRPSEALPLCRSLSPDVCVVDISMPELNGLQLVPLLKQERRELRVVFLTSHSEATYLEAARDAGADGFVIKTRVVDQLVPAILGQASFFDMP